MFQSKLHSSADQILFEFDGFCKPQNMKGRIHFNTSLRGGGYIWGGRRLDRRIYGGLISAEGVLITKSLWYLANKYT